MSLYHVVINSAGNPHWEMLFSDLSKSELQKRFIKPYQHDRNFLVTSKIIKASELNAVRIIKTEDTEKEARARINKADLADIAEMNRDSEIVIVSPGIGHKPEHLTEAGDDVTSDFLNSGPGSTSLFLGASKKAVAWTLGIVAAIIATALGKWIGLN